MKKHIALLALPLLLTGCSLNLGANKTKDSNKITELEQKVAELQAQQQATSTPATASTTPAATTPVQEPSTPAQKQTIIERVVIKEVPVVVPSVQPAPVTTPTVPQAATTSVAVSQDLTAQKQEYNTFLTDLKQSTDKTNSGHSYYDAGNKAVLANNWPTAIEDFQKAASAYYEAISLNARRVVPDDLPFSNSLLDSKNLVEKINQKYVEAAQAKNQFSMLSQTNPDTNYSQKFSLLDKVDAALSEADRLVQDYNALSKNITEKANTYFK